ncbi:MAG: HAD family phosphatase [Candidatus Bathyarchaeia archaeon]
MVTAVIFDWDGTLAETKKAVVESFQKVLTDVGCKVTDQFLLRLMGVGTRNTIIQALEQCNMPYDEELLVGLIKEKVRIQTELTGLVELFEGATELLAALKGRTKIALATMSGRKVINKVLKEKGIRQYFDAVVTANEVTKPKPDPEVFQVAATELKVNPEDCVVIEDSVFGVQAAKTAKMRCIAIPSGVYSAEELGKENPDMLVSSLAETKKILSFVFGNSA